MMISVVNVFSVVNVNLTSFHLLGHIFTRRSFHTIAKGHGI